MCRAYLLVFTAFAVALIHLAEGQKLVANYDESKIPEFDLPDPLLLSSGARITSAAEWEKSGRPATLKLIESEMYGRMPVGKPAGFKVVLDREVADAIGGKAIRREYLVTFADGKGPEVRMLLYLPKNRRGPVPAFLGLNFRGNQCVEKDPRITLELGYVVGSRKGEDRRAKAESMRGSAAGRWPIDMIVESGFALATACCGNIDPDFDDGWKNGVHPLYTEGVPNPHEWGTISAWAWGLSRRLDALEGVEEINAKQGAVIGHSRLGKTSLWAGATDPRFQVVISNNSGCGGAALSKRAFGETVGRINRSFPHWFNGNFKKYNGNEKELPFDQHQLIALMAPRAVYVASATEDRWADPRGEFLSLLHAQPVYDLYRKSSLGVTEMPAAGQSVGTLMGYHLRDGKHDVTPEDWAFYLAFAKRNLGKNPK
ncbi:MAG: acetylxylan esterase [Roseibacillus sp.]|nr:acetylxylan esterase [Roseibacillus sp.]